MHGHVFADEVAGSDNETGWLTLVTGMLRRPSQDSERVNAAAVSDLGVAFDYDVRGHPHILTQGHA
jgi:hypothetical protein